MKSLASTLFVGLIVLTSILTSPAPGLAQSNVLQVTCLDQAGKPVPGVKVFAQNLQTGKLKDQNSNRDGISQLKDLENGVYRVLGRKEGFEPAYYEFIQLGGGSTEKVTLNFKPGDVQKKIYFEDQALSNQSYDLLLEGVQALQANKWAEGEEKLKACLAINPSNSDAHFNLAVAYIQQRKFDLVEPELKAAAKLLEMSIAIERAKPSGPESQGSPMLKALEDTLSRVGQIQQMLPAMKVASEADALMAQKNFEGAAAKYSELIKIQPDNPDHYYNLAIAQGNAKHLDEAIATIDKGLALRPDDKSFQSLRTQLVNNKEAMILDQAKKMLAQGDELYTAGQYAAALQKYQEAWPLIPQKVQHAVWVQLGRTHAHLNQPEEAVKAFLRAIELEPKKAECWKALADFYIQQKQYDEALQTYADMYKQTTGAIDEGMFSLGKEFLGQEKNDLAVAAFNKVLEVNPEYAEAFYELGVHYFYNDNKPRAKELLTKYLTLGKEQKHLDDAKALLTVMNPPAKKSPPAKKRG